MDPTESTTRGITILNNTSLEQQIEKTKEILDRNNYPIKETKVKVGGLDGVSLQYYDTMFELDTDVVFIQKDQYVYQIYWIDDQATLDQIFSTFKFVD